MSLCGPPKPPRPGRGLLHLPGERTGRHWMTPDPDMADIPARVLLLRAAWLVVWIVLLLLTVGFVFGQWQ